MIESRWAPELTAQAQYVPLAYLYLTLAVERVSGE